MGDHRIKPAARYASGNYRHTNRRFVRFEAGVGGGGGGDDTLMMRQGMTGIGAEIASPLTIIVQM